MADGSSPETARDVIYRCLEELTGQEFKLFQAWLQDSAGTPGQVKIPRSRLECADRMDTANTMTEYYKDQTATEVTRNVLRKIPRNDLVQRYFGMKHKLREADMKGDVMRVETSGASEQTARQDRLTETGDIMRVKTSGASEQTARQDRLTERGVAASRKMAQDDSANMQKYKGLINSVAREKNLQAGIIAGIISRESRAGADLIQGWDDDGNCFGLMQVAKEWHIPRGGWDSKEHISQATGTLVSMITNIQKKFPKWTREQQLKGGIAAYNCGPRRVSNYDDVDRHTIGGDYSNDVVARAQWYQQNW